MLDSVNLNHLKVFETVYRTKSMTLAASELHLTQSGISQHIKALEGNLKIILFDRVSGTLLPTTKAHALYKTCKKMFLELGETILNLSEQNEKEIKGIVRVGVPIEFGNSMILPKLSALGKKHTKIQFDIKYGFATGMNEMLLADEIDFALVDDFKMASQIEIKPVFTETLHLCVLKSELESLKNKKDELGILKHLSFVDYQRSELVLRKWFKHHFRRKSFDLPVRAWAMDVQGLSKLILNGLGAGVLPEYVIQEIPQAKELLYVFKGKNIPMKNSIAMASVKKRHLSTAALTAQRFLLSEFGA